MLQVQTLPNATPPISKIHLSRKIALTFKLIMSLNVLTDLESAKIIVQSFELGSVVQIFSQRMSHLPNE